jgi:hypothetical protein
MATKYVIRDKEFIGYNDTAAPEFIDEEFVADALNCFMRTGEIMKRKGYTIIGNDLGSMACQGLKGVKFANGTKELLGIFNGLIYKWTGSGSWSALSGSYTLSTSAYIDIVVANNNVYFFDGVNTVPKYNGTTVSTVAAIPLGKYAEWFHNQLHVAGISGSPNKLQTSELGDPEVFTGGASSNLDVNPNDGDEITGLGTLKDELIVFKKYRVWSLTGFGTASLTVANINERVTGLGTLSNRSIVNTGDDLLYVGFLGDRPIVRSLQRTREGFLVDAGNLSEEIETTMNGLNKGQLTLTAGIFDGRYVWFAVPNGSSTYNNLVLTLDTATLGKKNHGWTRHTGINASVFESFIISSTPQLYFGESNADSKAYVFDTSTSDNGTAIEFSVTSRRYGGNDPELKKKFKYLYVHPRETGNYDLTVDVSRDGFSYENLGTINLAGTGSLFDSIVLDSSRLGETDVKTERLSIAKSRNRYIQFKMYETSATSSVTIRNWELIYYKKALVDA